MQILLEQKRADPTQALTPGMSSDAPPPETLPALAAAAGIPASELALYEKEHLEELMKELKIPVTVRVRLHKQHRDHLAGAKAVTVQTKFDAFFSRVGGASSLAGLQGVPVSSLPEAVSFICGPACPAPAILEAAVARAYAKADALLAEGPDPHGLSRDEIAAINLFTQDALYRQLNEALRSETRSSVKAYWGYIRLLQHSLFKLPKSDAGTIFRGVKEPNPAITLPEIEAAAASGEAIIWWGFSSTSTNLKAVNKFLGTGQRVIFTVDGGSSARDVRRYSDYVAEDELLMPCGTAFVVKTASAPAPGLLLVSVRNDNSLSLSLSLSVSLSLFRYLLPYPLRPV